MTQRQPLVFVVEDDLAVRESLKFALRLEGLEVHACGGGADLLMHRLLPHARCIVLDCEMPVMDGYEVLRRLKASDCHVPVVLITSHSTRTILSHATRAGVRHVIEKAADR
jgi:two-component system response regulator FixJ